MSKTETPSTAFAVIKHGGKQYKCRVGDVLTIEKFDLDASTKSTIPCLAVFNDKGVLASGKSSIEFEVVEHVKDAKKMTYKREDRSTNRRKVGHRQKLTVIKVLSIKTV